jgi:hypothetical protein
MSNNFKEKINKVLNTYKKNLNTNTFKIISNNKNCDNSNVSFTRDLALNQITGNQKIFSRIFNCTINKAVEFLGVNVNSIKNSFNSIINNSNNKYYIHDFKKLAIHKSSSIIENKIYFNKMLLIFFFYFGIQRNLIYLMQDPFRTDIVFYNSIRKNFLKKFGYINKLFCGSGNYTMDHPLGIDRLKKNLSRILENCEILKNINNNFIIEKKYDNSKNTKTYDFRIYFDGINIFDDKILEKKECYMIIQYLKIGEVIYFYASKLGNFSLTIDDRLYYLNVMSKILYKLDENKKLNTNIEKQKEYIVAFYYLLILLMPFQRGTASIAEMSLYSLWKYYIGIPLNINQNVLLDVEVLTLPFSIFYINCFNGENRYLLY